MPYRSHLFSPQPSAPLAALEFYSYLVSPSSVHSCSDYGAQRTIRCHHLTTGKGRIARESPSASSMLGMMTAKDHREGVAGWWVWYQRVDVCLNVIRFQICRGTCPSVELTVRQTRMPLSSTTALLHGAPVQPASLSSSLAASVLEMSHRVLLGSSQMTVDW
jgi:hypothetical protein